MTIRFKRVIIGRIQTDEYKERAIRRLQDHLNNLADDVADVRTTIGKTTRITTIVNPVSGPPETTPPPVITPPPVVTPPVSEPFEIVYEFGDGIGVPAAGSIAGEFRARFDMNILDHSLVGTPTGSATLVYEVAPFVNPLVWSSIVGSNVPTLAGIPFIEDLTLQGWQKTIKKGTWVRCKLNTVTTCTKVTGTMQLVRL